VVDADTVVDRPPPVIDCRVTSVDRVQSTSISTGDQTERAMERQRGSGAAGGVVAGTPRDN